MTTRLVRLAISLLIACGASWSQVTIVAASEYRPALEEIRKAFQDQTGIPTRVTYGNSGAMAERAKAPGTDIFLSSDKSWADTLAATSRADDNPIVLGSQPVCIWVRGSGLEPSANLGHLAELSKGEIVVSDTTLSPIGVAALKALRSLPNWNTLRPRLVVMDNEELVVDSLSRHSHAEATEIAPRDTTSAPPDTVAAIDTTEIQADSSDTTSSKKRVVSKGKHRLSTDSLAEPEPEKKISRRAKLKKQVVVVTKKAPRTLSNGFLPQPLLWNSPQSGPLAGTGRWTPVDPEILPPLLPSVIRLKSLNIPRTDAAKSFLAFLQSPRARSILRSNGFLPPP